MDVSLSPQKAQEVSHIAVAHLNAAISELRRLFLVEDLVDSFKFGVLLWVLTYLGSWFNGMTLVIIGTWIIGSYCSYNWIRLLLFPIFINFSAVSKTKYPYCN